MSSGGDWLGVEFLGDVDADVDVGVVNGSDIGGGGCSCYGSGESVRVGCALGGWVVTNRCWGVV